MARPGLTQHRKFRRLARALGSDALARGCLELMWDTAYENGDDYLGDADDVESSARWTGTQGQLLAALLDAGGGDVPGFVEECGDRPGRYRVHDLWHHAPEYVAKRRRREEQRREKGDTKETMAAVDREMADTDRTLTGQRTPNGRTPSPSPSPSPGFKSIAAVEPPHPPLELLSTEPPQQVATRQAVLEAIAAGSKGRFKPSKPTKGGAFKLDAFRKHPEALDTAQRVGEWLGAGGDAWKGSVDGRSIGTDLDAWVAQAKAWDGKPITKQQQGQAPAPSRPPPPEWKPKAVRRASDEERKAAIAQAEAEIAAERGKEAAS